MAQQKKEQVRDDDDDDDDGDSTDEVTFKLTKKKNWCMYFRSGGEDNNYLKNRNTIMDHLKEDGFKWFDASGSAAAFYYKSPALYAKFVKSIKDFAAEKKIPIERIMLIPDPGLGLSLDLDFWDVKGYKPDPKIDSRLLASSYKNHFIDEVVEAEIASFSHFVAKK